MSQRLNVGKISVCFMYAIKYLPFVSFIRGSKRRTFKMSASMCHVLNVLAGSTVWACAKIDLRSDWPVYIYILE